MLIPSPTNWTTTIRSAQPGRCSSLQGTPAAIVVPMFSAFTHNDPLLSMKSTLDMHHEALKLFHGVKSA